MDLYSTNQHTQFRVRMYIHKLTYVREKTIEIDKIYAYDVSIELCRYT